MADFYEVRFTVRLPDGVNATPAEVEEWLRFCLRDTHSMSGVSPLVRFEPEPLRGTFRILPTAGFRCDPASGGPAAHARQIEECPELNLSNYDAVDVGRLNDRAIRADAELERLYAHGVAPTAPTLPDTCDGKEQEAFEQFLRDERMSTETHPLHYLFLDAKSNAARQAWKAAIRYCRKTVGADGVDLPEGTKHG